MLKRKITAVMTALVLTAATALNNLPLLSFKAAAEPIIGDVNLNGRIEAEDLQLLQSYLLEKISLAENQGAASDINVDGAVDIFDLIALRKELSNALGLEKYSGLVINEVCSSNKESFKDAMGASPDWLEIYNGSGEDLSLDGIGVSDGANNKFKFAFPEETVIPAGGYIIVCCDDAVNQVEGEYHAAFKISATGETIYLTHPLYGEIDSVAVPELNSDVTYGRYANGSENFTYLSYTPGASNDFATDLNLVEKPVYSAEGGFYDSGFNLALSDSSGNDIYYTTDGSDPTTSATAKLYTGEINIYNNTGDANKLSAVTDISLYNHVYGVATPVGSVDKGIIVRAVAKTADGRYSQVATNGYYIGKTASYYNEMKVVSMSTDFDNLFDEDTGAYVVGSGYYEWKNSSEYTNLDPGDVNNPTNYNKDGIESEFPVNIQVFENGKLAYTSDMGARISGNWTRSARQKSFRLYARSDYGDSKMKYEFIDELTDINGNIIDSFDKITIRNGGNDNEYLHFRDALIQDLVSDLSPDTMGAEPCILFIDGEFWGFYMLREKTDGDYIESHYGINKDDITVLKNGTLEDGLESDLVEYEEFCKWATEADMSVEENYQKFCDTIDIQSFMDYMAVETYVNNSDWVSETYVNNWQVWRSNTVYEGVPESDGKWRFIFYDMDISTSLYQSEVNMYHYDSLNTITNYPYKSYDLGALLKSVMHNPAFAQKFYDNYIKIMESCFAPTNVDAKITEYVNAYEEATKATFLRFGAQWAANDYNNQVNLLREFFQKRPSYAKKYLDEFCSAFDMEDSSNDTVNLLPDVSEWTYYGTADFTAKPSDSSFIVNTPAVGTEAWDIQSQAKNISLENGKTYLLTFEASCSVDTIMTMGLMHYYNSEYIGCWYGNPALTSDMQKFTYLFKMDDITADDWFLYFNYAGTIGEFTVQNARLTEVSSYVEDASTWMYYNPTGSSEINVTSADRFVIDVTVLPDNTYDAQAYYGGIELKKGETYTYCFTVESTAETQLKAKVQQNYGEYVNYSNVFADIGAEPATYTVTFTAEEDCSDARISFNCGYAEGTVTVSNIMLVHHN